MRLICTLLLLMMATPAFAANLGELNRQVDNVVIRIKGADKDAVEYRKVRAIHFIDVDGDGVQDALVFFTIEGMNGGNNYEQYLTVLKGQVSGFITLDTVVVGGGDKGAASYELPIVKERRITIQRTEYADDDSRCCPSIKSSITFDLQGSKLVEVPRHNAPRSSNVIEKIKELKPDYLELSNVLAIDGQITVEGYSWNARLIPEYLHAIEENQIGVVHVKEMSPALRDKHPSTHFIISVVPVEPDKIDVSANASAPPKVDAASSSGPANTSNLTAIHPKNSMPAGDLTRDKNPPEVEALIGKQIPRIGIPGWSKLSGSLFESSQQSAQAMGLEVMDRGGKSIFLIELIDTKNDYATVLDAQILPKQPRYDAKGKPIGSRKENARLYSFTEGCQRENAEAVIVGTALPEQDKEHCGHWTKRVQRAWMIDPQTGRITEISPEGVSCLIESEYDCAN